MKLWGIVLAQKIERDVCAKLVFTSGQSHDVHVDVALGSREPELRLIAGTRVHRYGRGDEIVRVGQRIAYVVHSYGLYVGSDTDVETSLLA